MAINYLFFSLSLSPQSLFAYILSPYPLGHQCRVYIYVNVVLAGRPGEIRKWLMRSYIYIYLYIFTTLATSDSLFLSLSPPHRRKMSLISVLSVPSLSRQMNEWAWCIDRSREFLISPNRSSSIFSPSLFHITFGDMCLVLVLFLIAGHKGPTGVHTERGGVGSKSSMRIYCAGRRRRSRRKKGIKI